VVPLDAGCQVRLAQARIFQRIGRDGSRLAELAQVTKQTAGALVDQLEAAGHVERRPDPSDKGARLVCISDPGAKARAVWTAELNRVQGEWATESPTRTARQPGSSARMSGLSISR
jgi:DNA-binding MarR family transcriptional regulator